MKKQYQELDEARRILGLGLSATLAEIKAAYRDRIKKSHPDAQAAHGPAPQGFEAAAEAAELIRAYRLLLNYVDNYPFSFTKDQFKRVLRQDPTWAVARFFEEEEQK